jgi:uncharacterized integral membrane protein (TIGR00697 family)
MNEMVFFGHIALVVTSGILTLRKFGAMGLTVLVSLQALFANLFVVKQMALFGLTVSCSDVFAIGCILCLNLLQEFFGKEAAKKAMNIAFLSMVFFAIMSQIHLFYSPSPVDQTHSAFAKIFSSTPRIIAASIAVFYLVQQIDIRVFSYLQTKTNFPLRLTLSLILSQTLDTVLFSYLGLYGIVSPLFDIILISLFVKFLTIAMTTPFTRWMRYEL